MQVFIITDHTDFSFSFRYEFMTSPLIIFVISYENRVPFNRDAHENHFSVIIAFFLQNSLVRLLKLHTPISVHLKLYFYSSFM